MPRTARASVGEICYHVLNRGNNRAAVFLDSVDYQYFVDLIAAACERLPMRVLAYCLLPNHFHLVLQPHGDGDLGRWMQWLMTSKNGVTDTVFPTHLGLFGNLSVCAVFAQVSGLKPQVYPASRPCLGSFRNIV